MKLYQWSFYFVHLSEPVCFCLVSEVCFIYDSKDENDWCFSPSGNAVSFARKANMFLLMSVGNFLWAMCMLSSIV